MIHYLLQIVAFQLLFLVVYDLFLKNETFFKWNRAYLLLTPVLSFVLPLIKIDLIRRHIPEEFIIQLPAVILNENSSSAITSETLETVTLVPASTFSFSEIIQIIWVTGAVISVFIFL